MHEASRLAKDAISPAGALISPESNIGATNIAAPPLPCKDKNHQSAPGIFLPFAFYGK
jgi:hypothetical protein